MPVIGGFRRRTRKSKIIITKRRPSRSMTLTELQKIAKKRGIPFGGLSKEQLIRKMEKYHH
jgi:hypothetical protein